MISTLTKLMGRSKALTIPVAVVGIFLACFPLFGGPLYTHILILMALHISLASSYRVFYVAGMASFCHITFYAIGAYTSTLLSMNFGLPWGISFLGAGALAALLAWVLAWPAVRVRGPYFFLITFGFFLVMDTIFAQWEGLTGGRMGISGIPKIMGFTSEVPYYYIAMAFAFVTISATYLLDRSRFGQELIAIGDSEDLAEAVGINVIKNKVLAFVTGAFIAGLAGSIYAHYMRFICPASFGMWYTIYILIWVVLGGGRKVWGPIAGATVMTLIAEGLRMSGMIQGLLYAAALFTAVMVLPHGIVGLVDTFRTRFKRTGPPSGGIEPITEPSSSKLSNKEGNNGTA